MAYCAGMGRVAILGQSLCTGYGSSGYPEDGLGYEPTETGWWAQFERAYTDTTWVNYAHNGAMVSDFLPGGRWETSVNAVDELAAARPNRLLLVLGGNEFFQGIDPWGAYWRNLNTLVGKIRDSFSTKLTIVAEYDFPAELSEGSYPQVEYRKAAALTAANHSALFLDLSRFMPSSHNNTDGYYIPDEYGTGLSVHLTDAGHNKMAEVIGTAVLPCPLPG